MAGTLSAGVSPAAFVSHWQQKLCLSVGTSLRLHPLINVFGGWILKTKWSPYWVEDFWVLHSGSSSTSPWASLSTCLHKSCKGGGKMDFGRGEIKEKDPNFWQGFILWQKCHKSSFSHAFCRQPERSTWLYGINPRVMGG